MPSFAVEVGNLEQSKVPVASRSDADRNKALSDALGDVLLKNSGSRAVLDNPLIKNSLNQAAALVTQFGYSDEQGQLMLQATFEQDKVIALLRQAGLPVWGKQRPLTLFWLASDVNGERAVVADGTDAEERKFFADASAERGIPVLFPLMDLDELMTVNVNDIRGQFVTNMSRATERYQTDYFAIANLESEGSAVHYQIALYAKSAASDSYAPALIQDQATVADKPTAIAAMMLALSDYFVSRYAVSASATSQQTEVTFSGIRNINQLVEIESFLKQVTAIKSYTVQRVQGDRVSYRLQLFGSMEELKNLLGLESRLSPVENLTATMPSNSMPSNSVGVYQWRSRQ